MIQRIQSVRREVALDEAAGSASLRAKGVRLAYRGSGVATEALRGVDLCVQRGEFVSIMGPSGSGKSTLLHVLAGLERPDQGSVWLGETDLASLGVDAMSVLRRREIGFVFQFFNLVAGLTVLENVMLPLLLDGVSLRTARPRALALLGDLGLADRQTHRPSQLSGGQMQRAAIARALVPEPKVVLADEPTGNLDSATAAIVLDTLRSQVVQRGTSLVLVTHDPRAAAVADRVLSIEDGRLSSLSAPASARA
jgi:putative ABC transport system ATP-binding protein